MSWLTRLLQLFGTNKDSKIDQDPNITDVKADTEERKYEEDANEDQDDDDDIVVIDLSSEPDRPSYKGPEMWYPGASIIEGQKTQGEYPSGYPEGAIIHFTAGRRSYHRNTANYEAGKVQMEAGIAENKYAYFIIGMDGTVWQSVPLNRWGYHAGKAFHPALNTASVSKYCVGIEICNAGQLDNGVSWYKEKFPEDQIRTLQPNEYENCKHGGQFLKFTTEQEEALKDLLLWLHENNPSVFKLKNVYGHDEVAPQRKTDPGGSLSMSMPKYRKYLKRKANKRHDEISLS